MNSLRKAMKILSYIAGTVALALFLLVTIEKMDTTESMAGILTKESFGSTVAEECIKAPDILDFNIFELPEKGCYVKAFSMTIEGDITVMLVEKRDHDCKELFNREEVLHFAREQLISQCKNSLKKKNNLMSWN